MALAHLAYLTLFQLMFCPLSSASLFLNVRVLSVRPAATEIWKPLQHVSHSVPASAIPLYRSNRFEIMCG